MDPAVVAIVIAAAAVAIGFVAWQAATGAGVVLAYRDRAADASPPLAVFVRPAEPGGPPRLLVRNRGSVAAVRVELHERRSMEHDAAALGTVERIEAGEAADVPLAAAPTAPTCHVEWTPDVTGALRRQADVPFLALEAPGA